MRLIVLLLAWPLAEIVVLILVGGWIGTLPTLAVILGTGIWGFSLFRNGGASFRLGGLAAFGRPSNRADPGPGDAVQTMFRFLAAILLFLPGFLGDAIGLLLLVRPVQRGLMGLMGAALLARFGGQARANPAGPKSEGVIDATYEVLDPGEATSKAPSGWTRH